MSLRPVKFSTRRAKLSRIGAGVYETSGSPYPITRNKQLCWVRLDYTDGTATVVHKGMLKLTPIEGSRNARIAFDPLLDVNVSSVSVVTLPTIPPKGSPDWTPHTSSTVQTTTFTTVGTTSGTTAGTTAGTTVGTTAGTTAGTTTDNMYHLVVHLRGYLNGELVTSINPVTDYTVDEPHEIPAAYLLKTTYSNVTGSGPGMAVSDLGDRWSVHWGAAANTFEPGQIVEIYMSTYQVGTTAGTTGETTFGTTLGTTVGTTVGTTLGTTTPQPIPGTTQEACGQEAIAPVFEDICAVNQENPS